MFCYLIWKVLIESLDHVTVLEHCKSKFLLKTRDSTVSYDKIFIKLQQLSFSFFVIYGPQVLSRLIQMLVFDSIGLSIRTTINTYQFCLLKWGRKTQKSNISGFQLLGWITYLTHRSVCSSMFYKKPKHILKQPSTFLL